MPKLKGLLKLQGTMGDITFFKSQDGYIAKEKTSFNKEKYEKDKSYARTRENASEFGRAGKAAKLFRAAFRHLVEKAKDNRLSSRLTKKMMEIIKEDAVSTRGKRNVIDGETELLRGFGCNINADLTTTFHPKYTTAIDRVTGALTVNIPAFIPEQDIVVPEGTTHFKIVSAGAELDFENQAYVSDFSESAVIPYNDVAVAAITLNNAVAANSTSPLLLMLGIQFYQQVAGKNCPLQNDAYNSLTVVMVSGV